MERVRCPVCGGALETGPAVWRCPAGHSFDVARQGYVNLLPVQQKHSRQPGDSPAQVRARRAFLAQGHYRPLAEAVADLAAEEPTASLLDAGCGEGYYLEALGRRLPAARRWGIDISKEAVRLAAGRDKGARFLTASAAHLPFDDGGFACLTSLFALTAPAEFARVLAPGGRFLQVTAGPDHLLALRRMIYPVLRPRAPLGDGRLPGFILERQELVAFPIHLTEGGQVQALLAMTPHFLRISREGAERARAAEGLEDVCQAVVRVYRKA